MDATQGANNHYNTTSRVTVSNIETDVLNALNTLVVPGTVTELRVLGTGRGIFSGYYDDLRMMAADATHQSGSASGVYMTLNRVDTRLAARSHNRLAQPAKNTTADTDILQRLWLPIDFDPVRPSGISSTEEEHQNAIERAKTVQRWLQDIGFPEALLADSGNGAHLLVRIDLPNNDQSLALVKGCLTALDFMFGDELVRVDTTTSNAARIWKVYGTLARKGDNLPERPHRRASILHKPTELVVAGADMLHTLAGMVPQSDSPGPRRDFSSSPGNMFAVDEWIKAHNLPVAHTSPWQGGQKWVLKTCPWNPQHTDHAAYILQFPSGAIAAGCHHNGCLGKGWKELRALYDGTKRGNIENTHSQAERREDAEGQVAQTSDHAKGTIGAPNEWPQPPGEAAFAGLAGRVVEVADRHTEADRVAVLVSFLTAFGDAAGKGPYGLVGATEHYPRIFTTLVGRTSKGRKGESWSPVRKLFSMADPDWEAHRVLSGMSSGEGLISAVRDRVEKEVPVKDSPGLYETVVVDQGVEDKRLMVLEPEFARVLQAMARQGNILSAIIRDGWDRGNLNVMTKSALQATGAHICILGHVTADELRRELTDTEAANGFANRFIWFAVARSKELPNPTPFEGPDVEQLVVELKKTLEFAGKVGFMERTPEANELWEQVYHDLSAERDGLVWAVLGRAEAQTLRLSMLYALLDSSALVRVSHLLAALELWAYSERSVLHVFGDATGDHVADTIYDALKRRSIMTRTDISALFARNVPAQRLAVALALLEKQGKAYLERDNSSDGRPIEVWKLAQS